MASTVRFTVRDLELTPDDGNRYEIIDGDLHVSKQPHWHHQKACDELTYVLTEWEKRTQAGTSISAPGVIFADDQAVAPDLVWISRERFRHVVSDDGKLYAAPDLVVEVLSPGRTNEERDRELKLRLYSREGVREYWIIDWQASVVQVYRRENAALALAATLHAEDQLTSPLLPGFGCIVSTLCEAPF
ncbi:MAG TPA: Uma2 family endonuclease [Chloroflexota bacterium]|nr:Uma2 family endonuclease [Chloroflexota bacterium]